MLTLSVTKDLDRPAIPVINSTMERIETDSEGRAVTATQPKEIEEEDRPITRKKTGRKWKRVAKGIQSPFVGEKISSLIHRLFTVNQIARKGSSSISSEPVGTFDSKRKGVAVLH
ncbi:hypothetical protein Q3G72_017927 [Acer saccharum]|nr:hypothetical protein Q3G72_017927 [Acer saccharum]